MPERKTRIRVAVLIVKDEKVLLVRHHKMGASYWLLPGGGLEYGESIEECAKRELQEETGLEVSVGDLIYLSESIPPDLHRHVVNVYLEGKIEGGTLQVGQDDVLVGVEWAPVSQLEYLDLRPPIGRELLTYLKAPESERTICLGNRWNTTESPQPEGGSTG